MPTAIAKSLSRISRDKLLDLCASWAKSSKCNPYLVSNRNNVETEEEDYLHVPANSREELSSVYSTLKHDENQEELSRLSKKDIIDRIVEGDWRRGLSYHQLASIDFAKLEEEDTSLRWTALKLVPFDQQDFESTEQRPSKRRQLTQSGVRGTIHYPETTAAIFVQNLKRHISPLVKAYYHIHRLDALKLSVVRLHIHTNVPFAPLSSNVPHQGRTAVEASRIMYIALPDSCPFVYISVSGSLGKTPQEGGLKHRSVKIDLAATKKIVLEAIPKALSRPQQRWSLEPTKLTTKSLRAMCLLRGNGKVGTTGGAFSQLAERPDPTTGDTILGSDTVPPEGHSVLVERRFGHMAGSSHAKLDRLRVRVGDLNQDSKSNGKKRKRQDEESDQEAAPITITLSGSDVFAGLKQFALSHPEYVDLERLPAVFSGGSDCSVITL